MVKLNSVAQLGTGHTPDRTKPEYWENCDIPWVTAADLSQRLSEFEPLTSTEQQVSELGVANSAAVVHPPGTVMFCRTASVGLFCITGTPMATTQAFVTWTAGPRLDNRYLLYVIAAMKPEFERLAYGSTHLTIYMPDLEALRIPLPPLDEQRRIVDFLDDQVSRIASINSTLNSELAQLNLLDSASVDDELLERGLSLPQSLDDDFILPPEWRVAELGHILREFTNGFVGPTRDILRDEGIPYIQSLHVKNGEINFERRPYFVTREWHDARPRIHLKANDVLIVQTGDIGQVAVVPEGFGEASCHALQIARVEPEVLDGAYLGEYLRSHFGRHQLLSRATGALHPHLEAGIKSAPVVLPPLHVQRELVSAIKARRAATRYISDAIARRTLLLAEFKTSLITAVVSGQIDPSSASGGVAQ